MAPEETFSAEQEERIRALIAAAMKGHCRFPMVTDAEVPHVGHYLGMLRDLGGDSVSKGIETIRKNHEWLSSLRDSSSRAGSTVFLIIVGTVVTGALTALWLGFKHLVGKP